MSSQVYHLPPPPSLSPPPPPRVPSSLTADKFRTLVQLKCLRALTDPGEGVGLLAAQVCTDDITVASLRCHCYICL